MPRSFHRWLATLDPDFYEGAVHGQGWLATAVAGLVVIGIAGVLPPTRDFFGLDAGSAFVCFLPVLLLNATARVFFERHGATWELYGTGLLLTALFMIFFAGSLVALSASQGTAVMAAILFIVATAYGHILRATPAHPISLLPIVLGLAASVPLGADRDHLLVFSIVVPAAFGAHVVMGSVALEAQHRRGQHEAMKAAVQAQVLEERGRDVSRLHETILRILQNNHDAGNALSSALLNSQMIVSALEDDGELDAARFKDLSTGLLESLMRLRSLVDDTRTLGLGNQESVAALEEVELLSTVRRVTAEAQRHHPTVSFHVEVPEGLRVQASGGYGVLRRVLENLVLNACEGDGQRVARNVWVRAHPPDAHDVVHIEFDDDGPGFSGEQLAGPVQAFATTKPHGTGVGLYVVERLVRASRGELSRGMRPGGGARVGVDLRTRTVRT
jgi:two-component system C4-dicarboxylate transport sensor histidine kinase DctB